MGVGKHSVHLSHVAPARRALQGCYHMALADSDKGRVMAGWGGRGTLRGEGRPTCHGGPVPPDVKPRDIETSNQHRISIEPASKKNPATP